MLTNYNFFSAHTHPQGCGASKVSVSSVVDTQLQSTPAPQTGSRSGEFPIFLSFQVLEAKQHALALKAALERHGYHTFCSEVDIPRGANWVGNEPEWTCSLILLKLRPNQHILHFFSCVPHPDRFVQFQRPWTNAQ